MGPSWERVRHWYADAVTADSPLTVFGVLLAIALIVLAVSLFGLYSAFTMPQETEQQQPVPVVSYRQEGEFGYTVLLKDNSLFNTNQLGPGQTYFRQLVDRIQGTLSYSFSAEPPVSAPVFSCRATITFGSPDLWEREEVLVDSLKTEAAFSIPFNLSLQRFENLIETFRAETGAGLSSPQLTIRVQVEPQIETAYGPITEPFEQVLTFSFSDQTIVSGSELVQSQPGSITQVRPESTPGPGGRETAVLRIVFGAVAALSLGFAGLLVWWYGPTKNPISEQERELKTARKRLKGLLIQTNTLPAVKEEEVVVRLQSLEELLGLAEETLRPVMCSANQEGTVYCLIDGLSFMRYEYVSRASDRSKSP